MARVEQVIYLRTRLDQADLAMEDILKVIRHALECLEEDDPYGAMSILRTALRRCRA